MLLFPSPSVLSFLQPYTFRQIIPKTISPVLKCLWAVVKRHPLNDFIRFLSLPVIEYFHLSFHFHAPSALSGISDSFIHLGSESKICQWFFTFSFFLWLVGIQYLFYSDNISYWFLLIFSYFHYPKFKSLLLFLGFSEHLHKWFLTSLDLYIDPVYNLSDILPKILLYILVNFITLPQNTTLYFGKFHYFASKVFSVLG